VTPVTLGENPLAQVVAQVKFSAQSTLNSPQGASLFHDLVSEQYPRRLGEQQQTVIAGPGGLTTTATPQWRLTDLNGRWACVVGPEQLALETSMYTDWSEMRGRILTVLGALTEVTKVRVRERIGLRYVNHILPDDSGSFVDRISNDLLGRAVNPTWRQSLSAALAQTVFSDGVARLVIRAGTGEGIVEPVSTFILDIDCFDEQPQEYDPESTIDRFDEFNDVAYRCFCSCVPEEFRTTMK